VTPAFGGQLRWHASIKTDARLVLYPAELLCLRYPLFTVAYYTFSFTFTPFMNLSFAVLEPVRDIHICMFGTVNCATSVPRIIKLVPMKGGRVE
jgi:hypothetical protein